MLATVEAEVHLQVGLQRLDAVREVHHKSGSDAWWVEKGRIFRISIPAPSV
jgi:hypothetical protein